MKDMTIWQRLGTALGLMVLLLMAGGFLALRIEQARTNAERESERLERNNDHVYHQLAGMSDALRGLLLESSNEPERNNEKNRRNSAETTMLKNLVDLEALGRDQCELQKATHEVRGVM